MRNVKGGRPKGLSGATEVQTIVRGYDPQGRVVCELTVFPVVFSSVMSGLPVAVETARTRGAVRVVLDIALPKG